MIGAAFGVIVLSLVAAGAIIFTLHTRPFYNDDQVRERIAVLDVISAEMSDQMCARPAVGGTIASPSADLDELFTGHAGCLARVREHDEEISKWLRGELGDRVFQAPGVTVVEDDSIMNQYKLRAFSPPFPEEALPDGIRAILASCSELPAWVDQMARTVNSCSPPRWARYTSDDEDMEVINLLRFTAAAVLISRGALKLVVQALAVARNARLGRTGILVAMISLAGERRLYREFATLLMVPENEPKLSDEVLTRVEGWLAQLHAIRPRVHDMFYTEPGV